MVSDTSVDGTFPIGGVRYQCPRLTICLRKLRLACRSLSLARGAADRRRLGHEPFLPPQYAGHNIDHELRIPTVAYTSSTLLRLNRSTRRV